MSFRAVARDMGWPCLGARALSLIVIGKATQSQLGDILKDIHQGDRPDFNQLK